MSVTRRCATTICPACRLRPRLLACFATVNHRYTYRFLFNPGTIGAIAWLAHHEEDAARIKHGLVLACVGDRGRVTIQAQPQRKFAHRPGCAHVLKQTGGEPAITEFSPYGYDERQYCSPGFDLSVGVLSRTPYGQFAEYHTSADNLDFVDPASLGRHVHHVSWRSSRSSRAREHTSIRIRNASRSWASAVCYGSMGGHVGKREMEEALLWVLNMSDGGHGLLEIAERSGLAFSVIRAAADRLTYRACSKRRRSPRRVRPADDKRTRKVDARADDADPRVRGAAQAAGGRGVPVGAVHLYVGQEAVAVGICAALREDDWIASTHRGHGHCIAKGVDVRAMMAELYGKVTGTNRGKGGSMHITDVTKGMLGVNPIVGAGATHAIGAGLSAKVRKTDQVCAAFFGEGAAGIGSLHEAMNMAAIWHLPVLFVCENNGYAQATPVEYAVAIQNIADRAPAYGMPGEVVDGQDVMAVYDAAQRAVQRARLGQGPTLIECKTYRYYGHHQGDDPLRYRTAEEEQAARDRDCIKRFRQDVLSRALLTDDEIVRLKSVSRPRSTRPSSLPRPVRCRSLPSCIAMSTWNRHDRG